MKIHLGRFVLAPLFLFVACGGAPQQGGEGGGEPSSSPAPAKAPASPPATTPAPTPAPTAAATASPEALAALKKNIADTAARAEHVDPRVKVEHILISFAGRKTPATRTREEAEALAAKVLAEVASGADFSALRKKYSDDNPQGGIYAMVLAGVPAEGEYSRNGMVPAFGDVGWRLKVGEIGVAGFDPAGSPYGWHIVKRLE